MSADGPVILLAGPGDSTWIVANALRSRRLLTTVILEEPPSRLRMLRRRARRLGWATVAGQLAFLPVASGLARRSAARIDEICRESGMDRSEPTDVEILRVSSVNAPGTVAALQRRRPSVVVVNGTRIIAGTVLEAVDTPFVNTHAGITPAYRGVHGGYWALAQGDAAHMGVTVHLVDRGVDTGSVLAQAPVKPTAQDNFATYPYLQLAAGIPLLLDAVDALRAGAGSGRSVDLPSRLWSHPTLRQYLAGRRRGVR